MIGFERIIQLFLDEICRLNSDRCSDNLLIVNQIKNYLPICKNEETALQLLSKRKIDQSYIQFIKNPCYTSFKVPKKKGGFREIFAPEENLKYTQKKFNHFLQAYYQCIKPECVYGFTLKPDEQQPFCNIVKNAEAHINKRFVLNIDIKDFFPSISAKSVLELFRSELFRYNEQTSIAFALLFTYKGILPVGAPTSPVISNFICLPMDRKMLQFCQNNQLFYSRYADDLSFSSDLPITEGQISNIIAVLDKYGFRINKKKFRLQSSRTQQKVTGIVVNKKVNIDRRQIKKVRAMLHDLTKNGLSLATAKHFGVKEADEKLQIHFLNRLNGYIQFIGQVRGKDDFIYRKFATVFEMRDDKYVEKHFSFDFQGKTYRIYQTKGHQLLCYYNEKERMMIDIIDIEADQIIPFADANRQNELIVIKGKDKGIYYFDTDCIRWSYRGKIEMPALNWVYDFNELS